MASPPPPVVQVAIAGAVAGIIAIVATAAVERVGGRLGGVIGSLPSTIVPAAAFIWLAEPSAAHFVRAMVSVPLGMLSTSFFLTCWRLLPPRISRRHPSWVRLSLTLVASLSVWLVCALTAAVGLGRVALSAPAALLPIGGAALAAAVLAGIAAAATAPAAPRAARPVSGCTLAARGAVAAVVVGAAVALAQSGQALLAGLAASFPALFLTAMVSLWASHGEAVPAGAVGPLMLGSVAVSTYALLAAWTLPSLGLGLGSLAAWLVAVAVASLPAYAFLRWCQARRKQTTQLRSDSSCSDSTAA